MRDVCDEAAGAVTAVKAWRPGASVDDDRQRQGLSAVKVELRECGPWNGCANVGTIFSTP